MSQQEFEARVLEMWMNTRIPLTRANLMAYTKAPRKRMTRWLDEMVAEGVVEFDSDDEGEMVWTVRGAVRPTSGPTSMAELEKLSSLRAELGHTRTALTLATRASGLTFGRAGRGHGGDEKSVLASTALSLVLGPIGWLYAAPLREAIPAAVIYLFLGSFLRSVLPLFLVAPLYGVVLIMSALAGAAYAARYNERGERTSLAGEVKNALPSKRH
ncbi:MAG TPA: hypothetical protein VH877_18940 [Polyangia bacterium]|jgi:hypothetical protein|nr:hypothetical protein [Polyangia bacterium]